MPFYYAIDSDTEEGQRTAKGLLKLKQALDEQIPPKKVEGNLLLATWNIREFDSNKYGIRTNEPIHYIAEIISRFDIIAVQEVNRNLEGIKRLVKVLGNWWGFLITDTSGNSERLVYLYDKRKVRFGGLAAEVVLPNRNGAPVLQFARTPYIAGFQSGWFKFALCTVHLYYGDNNRDNPVRLREIEDAAKFLARLSRSDYAWSQNIILLGDFNIFDTSDKTMRSLEKAGFYIPDELKKNATNISQNKHYDQIAFMAKKLHKQLEKSKAGVFRFFDYVYRLDEESEYESSMVNSKSGEPYKSFTAWRTHQMSDHLPMWIEFKTDFSEEYLTKKFS